MKSFLAQINKRIHTANRLAVLVFGTSLLLLAIAGFGAWQVRQTQARSEGLLAMNIVSIQAAVELELHLQDMSDSLAQYATVVRASPGDLTDNGEAPPPTVDGVLSKRVTIEHWLRQAEKNTALPEARRLLHEIDHGLDRFYAQIAGLESVAVAERQREVTRAEEILTANVLAPARQYLLVDEALLETNRVEAANQSQRLASSLIALGIVGAVVAMVLGYVLARSINRSLVQVRIPMQDVAGKLSEVVGDVVISTKLDLFDLGPALERLSGEVKSVVEQLQVRHQEMLHAEQLATAGQLAAGIAHEIRNPLMSMKMLVQSAQPPEAVQLELRDLRILDEEIRRLEVLLDEFLNFARPRPLKTSLSDVRTVAESTVSFLQRQADSRNVVLECVVPPEPILLEIDPPGFVRC